MTLEDIERRLRVMEDIEEIKRLKARYCSYCDDNYDVTGSLTYSLKMRSGMVGFGARLKEEIGFVSSSFGPPIGFPWRCIW